MGDADRTGQDGEAGAGASDEDELFQSREDGQLHFIKETQATTFPVTAPIAEKAASTSARPKVGTEAAGNPSRSTAQPTPICRCGSSPDRYATTIGTSPGPADRSAAAIAAILASRPDAPATVLETPATSASSTRPL